MLAKLTRLEERLDELNALLSSVDATRDIGEYRRLNREHAELAEVVERFVAWRSGSSKTCATPRCSSWVPAR
jgi:peptide chain release factor 1